MSSVSRSAVSKIALQIVHRMQPRVISMLIAAALAGTAVPVLAEDPPPGLADDWSRGVWDGGVHGNPYTGFNPRSDYADSRVKVPKMPSFTPAYAKKYQEIREHAFEGRAVIDHGASCASLGIPVLLGLGLMEMLFSKDRVTMIWEEGGSVRRIHTDGRPHPADPEPTYLGHSIGHWEGRTLVVDTAGLRDDTYVELGMPHSDKLRVIERWTQTQPDTMEIDVTLIDPVMLTAPLHHVFTWTRRTDQKILEFFCTNNRERTVGGGTEMIGFDGKPLTGPAATSQPANPDPPQKPTDGNPESRSPEK